MDRYLPIGTVCTLNNTNRKYIIIGYFSLEYTSNIKLYDYIGLPYPEGFLMKNKINSFNHSEIVNIEHLGLINEDFENFNNILCDSSIESDENKETDSLFSNFTFDENGVVVYEYKTQEPIESKIIPQKYNEEQIVTNPFNKKDNYENDINIVENSEQWDIFNKNEEGILNLDDETKKTEILNFQFDDEGNVISEQTQIVSNTDEESNEDTAPSNFQFDENGIVVELVEE